jgi:hypothetical protein
MENEIKICATFVQVLLFYFVIIVESISLSFKGHNYMPFKFLHIWVLGVLLFYNLIKKKCFL